MPYLTARESQRLQRRRRPLRDVLLGLAAGVTFVSLAAGVAMLAGVIR